MALVDVLLVILASFRLTHLLVFDAIAESLRRPLETVPFLGYLIGCYWCCGVWSAAFLLLLQHFWPVAGQPLILLLAVAGGQALLESMVQRN